MKRLLLLACFSLWMASTQAAIEAYQFDSPQMEADYNRLINELRCLVCQNQNLSGSDADLARDLRRQTHQMLQQGNTPQQVVDFMVEHYGDFVLYRPQFKSSTYLLWLGPFVLLVLVLVVVVRWLRTVEKPVEVDASSMDEAKNLLDDNEPKQ